MKCQFCNERCRLLKKDEPDYSNHDMIWYCSKHPTRVLHHVAVKKYSLRRDSSIRGVSRHWDHTSVQWVNNKGQVMMAWYRRDKDEDPDKFIVFHVKKGKENWRDKYNEIFSLQEFPQDFTPENIAQKISTLAVFS